MSTHKYIGRVCWAALALVLAVTALLLGAVNQVTKPRIDAAQKAKTEAAMAQVEAIRRLEKAGTLVTLPDKLREVAALRRAHPEDTLAQLAQRCDPPITKSALNHRLRKLVELGRADL